MKIVDAQRAVPVCVKAVTTLVLVLALAPVKVHALLDVLMHALAVQDVQVVLEVVLVLVVAVVLDAVLAVLVDAGAVEDNVAAVVADGRDYKLC